MLFLHELDCGDFQLSVASGLSTNAELELVLAMLWWAQIKSEAFLHLRIWYRSTAQAESQLPLNQWGENLSATWLCIKNAFVISINNAVCSAWRTTTAAKRKHNNRLIDSFSLVLLSPSSLGARTHPRTAVPRKKRLFIYLVFMLKGRKALSTWWWKHLQQKWLKLW